MKSLRHFELKRACKGPERRIAKNLTLRVCSKVKSPIHSGSSRSDAHVLLNLSSAVKFRRGLMSCSMLTTCPLLLVVDVLRSESDAHAHMHTQLDRRQHTHRRDITRNTHTVLILRAHHHSPLLTVRRRCTAATVTANIHTTNDGWEKTVKDVPTHAEEEAGY